MSREEVDQLTANMERTDVADENIGLVNVYQRIRLFYGDACGIGITSRLGAGTEIRITLPVRKHSENMEKSKGEEDGIQSFNCR